MASTFLDVFDIKRFENFDNSPYFFKRRISCTILFFVTVFILWINIIRTPNGAEERRETVGFFLRFFLRLKSLIVLFCRARSTSCFKQHILLLWLYLKICNDRKWHDEINTSCRVCLFVSWNSFVFCATRPPTTSWV